MVIMRSVSKHKRLSELTVKIWMKIDLYCQRQRFSLMTLVSANLRFVPIFKGVHWREGVKRQRGNRKHGFIRLSTLRLRHAKKWDERYCILLFNPLSPLHWPRNIWPWLTLNGLNVHYTLQYRLWAVLAPENVKVISFPFCIHSAFASFRTWQLNDSTERKQELIRSRRNQRNPVENVTKCYFNKKILTQRNKQEYVI